MKNLLRTSFSSYVLFVIAITSVCTGVANAAPANNIAARKDTVAIQDAWVRPTSAGQEVGAAYMTLSSTQNVILTRIESDVSKSVEIHSMSMQNGIMKMRMLDVLQLSAGKPYKLEPGGFHLMLFDLKKPLKLGDQVNLVLHFKAANSSNKKTIEFTQTVRAAVQASMD